MRSVDYKTMKYSKKYIVNNARLEILYDDIIDEYVICNNNQEKGLINFYGEYNIASGKKKEDFYSEDEIARIKNILYQIMLLFRKKRNTSQKIISILNEYCIEKKITENSREVQNTTEVFFSFTYIVHNESGKVIASKYYITDHLDYKYFAQKLILDFDYIVIPKKNFNFSKENIILKNEAASKFFHEFIGHLLEEDHFIISPIRNMLGKKIFPPNLNIYENINIVNDFDDLGNKIKKDICLVRNGVVCNLLTLSNQSHGLNCENTGNAIIDSYNDRFSPRMRSMQIELPLDKQEDIFSGVLIEDFDVCEMNPAEGVIAFTVNKSYSIQAGEVQEALKSFTFLLSIYDLTDAEITAIGDEEEYIHYCIKNNQNIFTKCKCNSVIMRLKDE